VSEKTKSVRNFFPKAALPFFVAAIAGLFMFSSVFWAQGSTFNGQPASEVAAQSHYHGASGLLTVEEVARELAERERSAAINSGGGASLPGENAATSEESTGTAEEALVEEAAAEEAPEEVGIQATTGYIVPTTDAVAFLDPVPPGAIPVNTMAQLATQIRAANDRGAGGPATYIYLTANISGSLPTASATTANINNAGLAESGQGLTIDGRGHIWSCGAANGTSAIRVNGGANPRTLTLKNIDFVNSGDTATGDNRPAISFATSATGTGVDSNATQADSRFWTVNLHNIRSITSVANPAPTGIGAADASRRGLISLSDGTVNFSGDNHWTLGQRRTLVNARVINFDGGTSNFDLTRTATVTAAAARRSEAFRQAPSNDTARLLGVGMTLSNGADVTINRTVNSGTTARHGNVIRIDSGSLTAAASTIRPAFLNLESESNLRVTGNPRGNGNASVVNNGLISLRGGSGGLSVTEGSELFVHNVRAGTGTSAGTSALIQQIRGGTFEMSGEGTKATFITESAQSRRQGTVRFYMSGGVSNQIMRITDGAELNIESRRHPGSAEAAALRFGQGTGNGFEVENATVNIVNAGALSNVNSATNPGTSNANDFNAAVSFAANTWFFRVLGDSDMQIRADQGAAINARGHAHGEITVGQGANFTAMGRTAGVGATDAAIRATGGNVHFHMDNPQFYDFVNVRPGGGRVFALGTAAGNSFTSLNSDTAVWRRGVNAWNGDPDRHWTLIDYRLTGVQLRDVVDAASGRPSYPDFVSYYNTAPANSHRMENFTRISGNNSQPVVNEALDLTNADRHVRALAETPQGRIRDPRPVWTNELWANFTHTCGLTGDTETISSNTAPLGSLVRSLYEETLYEVETSVKTVDGALKMTHDDGRFLRAGDSYQIDSAWRATTPNLPRSHQASNIPPAFEFETVRDVVPPVPVMINDMVVPIYQTAFGGTWSLEDQFDDGPRIGSDGIRLHARNGNSPVREITGSGQVNADNTWTFTADVDQLFAGDIVWVSLADTQNPPNWNPLQPTPVRDRMIPEASWFIVAPDGTLPVIVQNFYEGIEHIPYRFISHQLSFPNPGDTRTVSIGTGTSTDTHIYTPTRDRRGYIVDRVELRGPGGSTTSIAIGSDGRPLAPIEVAQGYTTIHVHYVLDPDYRSDILVEFRFADYGGTGANSWILQVPVPYTQVRTGTYNAEGTNRFPGMGLGDFHITESLTHANVANLVNALFDEGTDGSGDPIPPVIDGLPRGFIPSPDNFIQLPTAGPGTGGTQLTFPVSLMDLEDSRVSAASGAERSPIIVNYTATLEEISLDQEVERCPEQPGSTAEFNTFDNMSFNYQLVLSRGPVGGVSNTNSAIAWQNHRLQVTIESERAEEDEESGLLPAWAHYNTHTWHGAAGTSTPGAIRIGTWNSTRGGGGGHSDAGTGTGTPPAAAATDNRRIGIEDSVTIAHVPSTAYVEVIQQVNSGRAGVNENVNATWLNNAIRDRHERDFTDSSTDQTYLWPFAQNHVSTLANSNTHTTNWANPLPTDSNSPYSPGRPMDNEARDFSFRLIPQRAFTLTVTNLVDGDGADMNRARNFTVQLRDIDDNYLPAGRQFMLFTGEYEYVQVGTDGEGYPIYEQREILTPVTVGVNGTISTGLPALLPGESFRLSRIEGMNSARVVMLEFPGHEGYEVTNQYVREREGVPSDAFPGMVAGPTSFNRDYLEVTFESYQDFVLPTGLLIGGSTIFVLVLVAAGVATTIVLSRRRLEMGGLLGGVSAPVKGISINVPKLNALKSRQNGVKIDTIRGRICVRGLSGRAVRALRVLLR